MFSRNNFVKVLLIFTIILGFLSTNEVSAEFSFVDFPQFATRHDISVDYSELGKDYVKVKMCLSQDESNFKYQLYYKEYDNDLNLVKSGTTNVQNLPVFHFQVSTMHFYDFCIAAFDEFGQIISNTPVERVVPGQFIDKPKSMDSPLLIEVKPEKSLTAIQDYGLEAILEIGHYGLPYINCLTEVKLNGVPFDGDPNNNPLLAESNFTIREDGRLQLIRDFVPPETGGNGVYRIADIVFVHDDSGSLNDEAAQVKQNIQDFVNQLNNSNIDYRIALLPYGGGGGFSSPEGTVLNNGILYSSASDFISDLDQMRFDGGTEKAFCAMQKAAQDIVWRPSTQKNIIFITDEDNDSGCINQIDLIALLQNSNIRVYALTVGHQEFTDIANATGGNRFNITADFTSILSEIGEDIANKYFIQYETDNKSLNGQIRTVELTVEVDDGQGGTMTANVAKTYMPVAPIEITLTPETEKLSLQGKRQQSPITIVVKITQGQSSFNGQATLYYTNSNISSYVPIGMNSIGNDLYSATIPASGVVEPSVGYYISSTDGTFTSTMPSVDPADDPMVISILPNSAPIITHTPVTSVPEGQDISVYGKVEDATNMVAEVAVFYRPIGSAIYSSISDTPNKEIVDYQLTIPGSIVTGNGLEYYIYAKDDYSVSNTFGTSDSPIQVFVTSQGSATGQKDIGNLTVYADSFLQDPNNNLWTASGNVMIGTKVGGRKLLSIGTSLNMHYDTNTVEGISQGNIIALDIKRNPLKNPENIPVYYGDFKIDCSTNPPVLTMQGGESKLRLIGNLPFLFPYAKNTITIKDDEIILHDVTAHITQGLNILITVGDIILSQTGGSSGEIKLSGDDLLKKYPIKGSSWTLAKLEFVIDLIRNSFTASGEFEILRLIGSQTGGIGATLGFLYDPFALETVGGKLEFPPSWQQILTIPTTPPSPLGARIHSGSFLIDKISSGISALQFTGSCGAKLVDATQIAEAIEIAIGYKPISGELALLIDLSGKVELSGAIELLEHFELASGKIGLGNPTYVEGNLNILDILIGRVYLSIGAPPGYLELIGQNSLTLQVPQVAPWIGGYTLANQAFDATLRFSSSGIDMAEFRTKYELWFIDLTIRLDISDLSNPDLFITGWNKTIQVFNVTAADKGTLGILSLRNININKDYEQAVVKITSDSDAPLFNITFPDNTTYTPSDATPTGPPDQGGQLQLNNLFWIRNLSAHESYYAINKPPKGTYTLEVTNDEDIGNYTVQVVGPNADPQISIDSPATDIVWDGSSPIQISWSANDPDDNADIDLYYDSDSQGHDGQLIVSGLQEEDAGFYQWNVGADVQSGSYYIYAKIDDGENAPVFAYSAGKIGITNPNAPAPPQNLVLTPQDGSLKAQWDANTEQNLIGYRVYVSENPGSGMFKYSFGSGLAIEYEIQGLVNGQSYEVAVSAVNADGMESNKSASETAAPNGTGLGGSPDLTVDVVNSSVSSVSGTLDGTITAHVRIKNGGIHDSYSARVSCYYGKIAESNLIESKLIGLVPSGNYIELNFELDTTTLTDKFECKNFFIIIYDVVLPELETTNNMAVIENTLFDHIELTPGWNLISLCKQPSDTSIDSVLKDIEGKYSSVWSFQNNYWKLYNPEGSGFSDLDTMEAGWGYWINMMEAATLTVTGTEPSKSIDLIRGWNLVGYNSCTPQSIVDALASIDGKSISVWAYINGQWRVYDPANPGFSDLTTMEPGYGYWIKTKQNCTWTLP